MTDFDYDCRQKKIIAQSARKKVNAVRGRKVTLPYEHMTRKELAAMNGEVKTYNIKKPMELQAFHLLPVDLQREHFQYMQQTFRANDKLISLRWHVSQAVISTERRRLRLPALGKGHAALPSPEQQAAWEAWWAGAPDEKEAATEANISTGKATPAAEAPSTATLERLGLSWNSVASWEELYERCKRLPFPEKPAHVQLEVN